MKLSKPSSKRERDLSVEDYKKQFRRLSSHEIKGRLAWGTNTKDADIAFRQVLEERGE